MASRCLEESPSGPPRSGSGRTARGVTTRAAARTACACLCCRLGRLLTHASYPTSECAPLRPLCAQGAPGEHALAVLAKPDLLQLILGHLERDDKMGLGSTCTSLWRASLAWFPKVTVEVTAGKTVVPSLAAWLERHQAQLHLTANQNRSAASAEWACSTIAALPTHLVSSLTTSQQLPAPTSTLTALTRLKLKGQHGNFYHMPVNLLGPLSRLQQLSLVDVNLSSNAAELLSLPALAGLQALGLHGCSLQAVPPALLALTQLTSLDVSDNPLTTTAPLAALERLQSLDLGSCSLRTVPEQVSALTALTRLYLAGNDDLRGGWQHLLPLTQLQDLSLKACVLGEVPEQLSALLAVTRLNLSENGAQFASWQHLALLTQLRDLSLEACRLREVPEQLSALTALTRLNLSECDAEFESWQHLAPLTQLCDLSLAACSLGEVPEQLSALTALTRLNLDSSMLDGESGWQRLLPLTQLQDLDLRACWYSQSPDWLEAVPEQLSALTALTRLNLSRRTGMRNGGWQHVLPLNQLQDLNLSSCCLTALPQQVSALMALTCLNLHGNNQLTDGWQHLQSSNQLQGLNVGTCALTTVPWQLSALTTLTYLDLSNNKLQGGWQHLLPLTQLRHLNLQGVRLPDWEPPPKLAALPRLCVYYDAKPSWLKG